MAVEKGVGSEKSQMDIRSAGRSRGNMLAATHRKSSGDTHEKLNHCGSRGVRGSLASPRSGSLDVMTGEGHGGGGRWFSLHVVCPLPPPLVCLLSLPPIPQFPSASQGLSFGVCPGLTHLRGQELCGQPLTLGRTRGKVLCCHMSVLTRGT